MDSPIEQAKQVFVDDSGRRGRFLAAAMRVGCVVVAAYLVLLVAGFMGASWVPSVRLPIVGDIFDVGSGDALAGGPAGVEQSEAGDRNPAAIASDPGPNDPDDGPLEAGIVAAGQRGRDDASGSQTGGNSDNEGRSATPAPKSSPNHGTAAENPNAGPKADKTPQPRSSPNHGSTGNSENAGPKPKRTKGPPEHSNSARNREAEPSPTPVP